MISDFGSEGVIAITLYLVVKELLIPMWKKIKPRLSKNNSRNSSTLHSSSLNMPALYQALKDHVRHDDETTAEIKSDIKQLEHKISIHGERLASLEARGARN